MSERLHKYLARSGVASRRRAEELINEGRVQVNNQTVREMGTKVEPGDLVTVDGSLVQPPEDNAYFILDGEVYWGNDRLTLLRWALKGKR